MYKQDTHEEYLIEMDDSHWIVPEEERKEVIIILQKWYWVWKLRLWFGDGYDWKVARGFGIKDILPDFNDESIDVIQAEHLAFDIEQTLKDELMLNLQVYWKPKKNITNYPRFTELPILQKFAMAQELKKIIDRFREVENASH